MLINILILSAIVERIWEQMQQIVGEKRLSLQIKLIGSAILSIAAAISLQLDLLFSLGVMGSVSWAGIILTGVAISLGSNVIHDLVDIVGGLSTKLKASGVAS